MSGEQEAAKLLGCNEARRSKAEAEAEGETRCLLPRSPKPSSVKKKSSFVLNSEFSHDGGRPDQGRPGRDGEGSKGPLSKGGESWAPFFREREATAATGQDARRAAVLCCSYCAGFHTIWSGFRERGRFCTLALALCHAYGARCLVPAFPSSRLPLSSLRHPPPSNHLRVPAPSNLPGRWRDGS